MDDNGKAEILNKHFCQVGPNLLKNLPSHDSDNIQEMSPQAPVFELSEISISQLAVVIRELRPSTSCGVDGLTARLIKQAGPSLLPPIVTCYQLKY